MPKEVWCSLTQQPDTIIDVTETWTIKLEALLCHKTQIGDVEKFKERMLSRHTKDSTDENPRYEEKFKRIVYK
jgi:LmbE family N-acetylglucosaminyl deacetylase